MGALKNNSILLWIVSLWNECEVQNVYIVAFLPQFSMIFSFMVWAFLDFELAVFDHVVLHFGGNSRLHSIGVSISSGVGLMFKATLYLC